MGNLRNGVGYLFKELHGLTYRKAQESSSQMKVLPKESRKMEMDTGIAPAALRWIASELDEKE